ncbi:sugar transporter [Shimia sp. R10_1]|nr:sugar transporter [Shimia sp. R10_1]
MLAEEKPVLPPAPPAKIKKRHKALIVSFMVMVVLPIAMLVWYMTTRVVEQFHSELSFSVRKEHSEVPTDFVGSLAQLSGASSSDVDVLYQFIKSQALVLEIDKQFDLRSIYTEHREQDPLFALKENATIEDLVDFWPRMVRIHYDRTTGIIELRVLAFSAETAREIAQAILDYSTNRINKLSAVARADTMRYANEELDLAVQRLTRARQALTQFRLRTQIVDPFVDLQGQMGVMNTLQAELATALIDLGLLRSTANIGDPRVEQGRLRVEVIKDQIAEERAKFGVGGQGPGGEDYASLVAEFERLTVDHEFAAEAYTLALSARDIAQAEAQRQSRYLAAHIEPTLAESSHYPRIVMIISISVAFLILIWATSILIYYSIRDRR